MTTIEEDRPDGRAHTLKPGYLVPEDEIDLIQAWNVVVKRRTLILVVTMVSTVFALGLALLMTPVYRAETLLAPTIGDDDNRLTSMSSQLGGLASLAGLSLDRGDGKMAEAIATLESRDFTYRFITSENLLRVFFEDQWDTNEDEWRNPDAPPTLWDAYELFDNSLRDIHIDKETGLITLAVEWKKPELAAEWANKLVRRVNDELRKEAVAESQERIQYLEKELDKTSIIEVKQAIYKLTEAETERKMIANTQQEYAFRVLDGAVVPEEKAKPNRKLIVLLGIIVGGLLGIIAAFSAELMTGWRK